MLGAIHTRSEGTYDGGQEDIIHLVASAELLLESSCDCVFSDRNACVSLATFHKNPTELDNLDWKTIRSRSWGKTDGDPGRVERKQAEFLVHRFMPWEFVAGIGVHNAGIEDLVRREMRRYGAEVPIKVKPGWYF
jgi:hypothetical protein